MTHEQRVKSLETEAANLTAFADTASEKAMQVGDKFEDVAQKLKAKSGDGGADAALDAKKLKERAEKLFQDTRFKFEKLQV